MNNFFHDVFEHRKNIYNDWTKNIVFDSSALSGDLKPPVNLKLEFEEKLRKANLQLSNMSDIRYSLADNTDSKDTLPSTKAIVRLKGKLSQQSGQPPT